MNDKELLTDILRKLKQTKRLEEISTDTELDNAHEKGGTLTIQNHHRLGFYQGRINLCDDLISFINNNLEDDK